VRMGDSVRNKELSARVKVEKRVHFIV
jgi:hypothetical protein